MKIGDRVNHDKYGSGTIKKAMFEDTKRELLVVEFDVSNSELHDCLGLVEEHKGLFCNTDELRGE